ncbi:glyoxalase [Paracoccus sediminicola]|uniref:glyoxalase n=1 Tax=Paracoccus sediminicola TaxID=3017783 RepID=UPI0022F0CA8C|nr:glyoxalase [Paracoccus sediminicola]WBU56996.1 glyoxalase [Paracoccus sediminicola]
MTAHASAAAEYLMRHFGFAPLSGTRWYFHRQMPDDPTVNLKIRDGNHDTGLEQGPRGSTGPLLNFEIENVAAEYGRLRAAELTAIPPLRNEDFGQRRFILQGPENVLIDIFTPPQSALLTLPSVDSTAPPCDNIGDLSGGRDEKDLSRCRRGA